MMTPTRGSRDTRTSGVPERSGGSRSEPMRSAGTPERAVEKGPPDEAAGNEVLERPKRRTFTAEYKARILREADACEPGGIGALLRREGLYSSHLVTWRHQRDLGALKGLTPRRRGRKAKKVDPVAEECERLRRENARLAAELEQAHVIIDVQKKVAGMLGVRPSRPANDDTGS